jgi:hypothetical protein
VLILGKREIIAAAIIHSAAAAAICSFNGSLMIRADNEIRFAVKNLNLANES